MAHLQTSMANFRHLKSTMKKLKDLISQNYPGKDAQEILRSEIPTIEKIELLKPVIAQIEKELAFAEACEHACVIERFVMQIRKELMRDLKDEPEPQLIDRVVYKPKIVNLLEYPLVIEYINRPINSFNDDKNKIYHFRSYQNYSELMKVAGKEINDFYKAANASIAAGVRQMVDDFAKNPEYRKYLCKEYRENPEELENVIRETEQKLLNMPSPYEAHAKYLYYSLGSQEELSDQNLMSVKQMFKRSLNMISLHKIGVLVKTTQDPYMSAESVKLNMEQGKDRETLYRETGFEKTELNIKLKTQIVNKHNQECLGFAMREKADASIYRAIDPNLSQEERAGNTRDVLQTLPEITNTLQQNQSVQAFSAKQGDEKAERDAQLAGTQKNSRT